MRVFNVKKTKLSENKEAILARVDIAKSELSSLQTQSTELDKTIKFKEKIASDIDVKINKELSTLKELTAKKQELEASMQEEFETYKVIKNGNENLLQEQKNIENSITASKETHSLDSQRLRQELGLITEEHRKSIDLTKKDIEKGKKDLKSIDLQVKQRKHKIYEYNNIIQKLSKQIDDLVNKKNRMLDIETTNLAIQDRLLNTIKELEVKKDKLALEVTELDDKVIEKDNLIKEKEKIVIELEDKAKSYIERDRKILETKEKIQEIGRAQNPPINFNL